MPHDVLAAIFGAGKQQIVFGFSHCRCPKVQKQGENKCDECRFKCRCQTASNRLQRTGEGFHIRTLAQHIAEFTDGDRQSLDGADETEHRDCPEKTVEQTVRCFDGFLILLVVRPQNIADIGNHADVFEVGKCTDNSIEQKKMSRLFNLQIDILHHLIHRIRRENECGGWQNGNVEGLLLQSDFRPFEKEDRRRPRGEKDHRIGGKSTLREHLDEPVMGHQIKNGVKEHRADARKSNTHTGVDGSEPIAAHSEQRFGIIPNPRKAIVLIGGCHVSSIPDKRTVVKRNGRKYRAAIARLSPKNDVPLSVIPAKAGIQRNRCNPLRLDSRLRGNDGI